MPTSPADHLRRRAAALRTLATELEQQRVLRLPALCGDETWMGPSPAACHDELATLRRRLLDAADEARRRAGRLEREAEALAGTMGPR